MIFISTIAAMALSLITAYLGFYFALQKFHQQKIWERREQAYSEIISALYDVSQYCFFQKNDYGQGTGLCKEKEEYLLSKYLDANELLEKATQIGLLYISEAAHQILRDLQQKPMLNPDQEPWFEVYKEEYDKHELARQKLTEVAQNELRLNAYPLKIVFNNLKLAVYKIRGERKLRN